MSAVKNIFAPRSSRVLRVLLVNSGRDWNERGLAPPIMNKLTEIGISDDSLSSSLNKYSLSKEGLRTSLTPHILLLWL